MHSSSSVNNYQDRAINNPIKSCSNYQFHYLTPELHQDTNQLQIVNLKGKSISTHQFNNLTPEPHPTQSGFNRSERCLDIPIITLEDHKISSRTNSKAGVRSRPASKVQDRTSKDSGYVCVRNFNTNETQRSPETPLLNEDEAKYALSQFTGKSCCSKRILKNMNFTHMESDYIEMYSLETFVESRDSISKLEPYDSQKNGIFKPRDKHLDIWSIDFKPSNLFQKKEIKEKEVPYTAFVRKCDLCSGVGSFPCIVCNGSGQVACKQCNSHGNRPRPNLLPNTESNACNTCRNDFGYMKCLACQDKDRTKCKACLGSKEMKHVIWARATFETFKDDLIKNNSNIPSDLLRNNCNKDIIFHEELDRIHPIRNYKNEEITKASLEFHQKHEYQFSKSRILKQRHGIYSIPVTVCKFVYKGKSYEFTVYGKDNKVFFPGYPKCSCCLGCCNIC